MRYAWYDVSRRGERIGAVLQAQDDLDRAVVLVLVEQAGDGHWWYEAVRGYNVTADSYLMGPREACADEEDGRAQALALLTPLFDLELEEEGR